VLKKKIGKVGGDAALINLVYDGELQQLFHNTTPEGAALALYTMRHHYYELY